MFAMKGIYENLIPGLWTAWIIYWWISARNVKATRREENAASRASHFVPLVIAVMLIAPARLPGNFLGARFLPASFAAFATGATLVAAGMALSIWARIHLGRNWSGTVTMKHGHELIRGGPYRFVRHPIYTGLLAAFAGSAIARGEWRGLVATLIAFLALWHKLRIEERWLGEMFGDDYAQYRREVPALIPFLL